MVHFPEFYISEICRSKCYVLPDFACDILLGRCLRSAVKGFTTSVGAIEDDWYAASYRCIQVLRSDPLIQAATNIYQGGRVDQDYLIIPNILCNFQAAPLRVRSIH
ncbi:hypothetical protein AA313_de0206719 [Arthrobotrys entomopaga]|nr:hypothetical protein AA313_de0206719 [Arthrobotrys entomopaga]